MLVWTHSLLSLRTQNLERKSSNKGCMKQKEVFPLRCSASNSLLLEACLLIRRWGKRDSVSSHCKELKAGLISQSSSQASLAATSAHASEWWILVITISTNT